MCIPFLYKKGEIPKKLPKELEVEVNKLSKCKSKIDCLKKAFNFVKKNFKAKRRQVIPKFFLLLTADINKLWKRRHKFLHCTQQNYLLRILLINSKKFKEKDIGVVNMIHHVWDVHQYLIVNVGKKWIKVDIWFSHFNIPLGSTIKPRKEYKPFF